MQDADKWELFLARNVHWLILLFLGSVFGAPFVGPEALFAILPAGLLLWKGMRYEAKHYAPEEDRSKFY